MILGNSLNKYQKLSLAILAIGALIAYSAYQLNVQTNQASIDYWISNYNNYCFEGENQPITINCKNGGKMDGDFNIVLTLVNATFSTQTEKPYTNFNDTLVKFRWILHEGESANRLVYFSVDKDVSGFLLMLSLEKNDQNPLKNNPMYPWNLRYEWTGQNFELVE